MTKLEKIKQNLEKDKEFLKNIDKVTYYGIDQFIKDAYQYIKAIQEGRMICAIKRVSSSGMSRNIYFMSCQKSKEPARYWYSNYYAFFKALGYTVANDKDSFRIGGCGMDMIFHTNYTNMHRLARWGFITKKICSKLAQMTPTLI